MGLEFFAFDSRVTAFRYFWWLVAMSGNSPVAEMVHDDSIVMDELCCLLMLHDCFVPLRGPAACAVALSIPLPTFVLVS